MTRADLIGGILLIAFFGAALWEASSFQYGTEFAPGPGFAPVWISVLGIVIALVVALGAWRRLRRTHAEPKQNDEPLDRNGLFRVAMTLIGLLGLVAAAPWLGFVPSIFAFLLFLTLFVQRLSVPTAIGASLGTVVFVYIVFVRLLEVPIPSGPLGF
jgi:putative tricarboxylic transport membrane protein